MKTEKRYTTTQAAKLLMLSPSTVLRAVQHKQLKAERTPGGHARITEASLDAFRLRLGGVT